MEPQTPVEQEQRQGIPQMPNLFIQYKKAFMAGGAVLVILIIALMIFAFMHPTQTPKASTVQTTTTTQDKSPQIQVLVVSEVPNITVAKVNNAALKQVFTDAYTVFSPNVQSIVIHLTDVPLTDSSKYMQHFIDGTQKIQAGFYETTNPSTMTEDIYIYKDNQDLAKAPSSFISDEYWMYTLDAIWYLAHVKDYTSTDTTQLKNAATAEYQFTQAHLNSAFTLNIIK